MKLKFLMSYCRKNSVRDKVIGEKWIYLERNRLHRQSVGCHRGWVWQPQKGGMVSFYGLGIFHRLMSGRIIPAVLGKGWRFPRVGPSRNFWSFDGVWNCHVILLADWEAKLTCLPSWIHLIPVSLYCILGLYYSFKSCALPLSLLFHFWWIFRVDFI